jgi:hypothetical protein
MVITFAAMGVQVMRDLAQGRWLVTCVGATIAVLTTWVALEGGLAWRRRRAPGTS